MTAVLFESFGKQNDSWSACVHSPIATWFAYSLDEVLPSLQWAEESSLNGYWVAVLVSYEAAPAFDRALRVHHNQGFPLVCVLVFDRNEIGKPPLRPSQGDSSPTWQSKLGVKDYQTAISRILHYISQGDSYQVNYTFPLATQFRGDPFAWYRNLCAAQPSGFCAYVDLGPYQILSFSPELFFQRVGNKLITRPMKGTMARGRWLVEDQASALALQTSPKNRAENIMIVDLLRNDLGKVSLFGSVRASSICEVEKYETLWQMTSTVESECDKDATLTEIFAALFPCGSITGAPKVRAMQIINELEPFPRGIYTGAIGLLQPGGDCTFNVAIRTIMLDRHTGMATLGVGGAITADSTAETEYDEAILKAAFLARRQPEFQLLETLLLEEGEYFLLEQHLKRIQESSAYFAFTLAQQNVISSLNRIRKGHSTGHWKVRLLVSPNGAIDTEVQQFVPEVRPMRVTLSPNPIDSHDRFLFHKTTNRSQYEHALHSHCNYDDVILWNENNEITETTTANIVVQFDEIKWTPPRSCGLLAGTFREVLLQKGIIQERVIHKEELSGAQEMWLINSVRKWIPTVCEL